LGQGRKSPPEDHLTCSPATTSAGPCTPRSTTPRKTFHHHDVGEFHLAYESVDMIADPGHTLYAAEPNSPTAQPLDLLASWAATDPVHTTYDPHRASDET